MPANGGAAGNAPTEGKVASKKRNAPPLDVAAELDGLRAKVEQIVSGHADAVCAKTGETRHGYASSPKELVIGDEEVSVRIKVRVPKLRRVIAGKPRYRRLPLGELGLKLGAIDVAALIGEGVSMRGVARVLDGLLAGGAPKGSSAPAVQVKNAAYATKQLQEIQRRRIQPEDIVAVELDGAELGGRTVVVAVGITVDGRRRMLGVAEGPTEHHELVLGLLEDMMTRGFDPRVLWIVDGGAGLWKGIRELFNRLHEQGRLSIDVQPWIQSCTVHYVRKVLKSLPEQSHGWFKELAYEAFREDEPDVALTKLQDLRRCVEAKGHAVAAEAEELRELANTLTAEAYELRAEGRDAAAQAVEAQAREQLKYAEAKRTEAEKFITAAKSMDETMAETLTVTRLGIPWRTRYLLRSTNIVEATIGKIDWLARNVTRWLTPVMRLLWSARALADAEAGWERVADPPDLVALRRELAPDLHDPAALLRKLPPTLTVERELVPPDEAEAARRLADDLLRGRGPPVRTAWLGSAEALGLLGLEPGEDVTLEKLTHAVQGRHVQRREQVREVKSLPLEITSKGKLTGPDVEAVEVFTLTLEASEQMAEAYLGATPSGRERIEQAVLASWQSAAERLSLSNSRGYRGVAAAAVVWVTGGEETGKAPRLGVEGVALGRLRVPQKGQARLDTPFRRPALGRRERRLAADAAHDTVKAALFESAGKREPEPELADPPAPRAADSLSANARYLPHGIRQSLERRVEVIRQRVAGKPTEWLRVARRYAGDPFGQLDTAAALAAVTAEQDILIARQMQVPVADIERLKATQDRVLHRDGSPTRWLADWYDSAATVVAIEREAAAQGLTGEIAEAGRSAALAHTARVGALESYRDLLGREHADKLAQARDWAVAGLSVTDPASLQQELAMLGEPLEDIRRALLEVPDEDRPVKVDELLAEHRGRTVKWLAIRGEIATFEIDKLLSEFEREAASRDAEPEVEAIDLTHADVEPVVLDVADDAGVGVEVSR